MDKNHQINATYDPNNTEMKQDFTLFCNYCKKSGHAVNFFWLLKEKKLNEEKAPPQPKEIFSQTNSNQQKLPKNYKSNQRGRNDSPYVANRNRSRSNSYSGTVRSESKFHLVNSLYDTLQSCNPLK